ncbi:MAG: S41 family peptidase [Pyrinomonadaceae bacterium]|nr:S41 family peptidase [Pyrinomonadaceae bacterium]
MRIPYLTAAFLLFIGSAIAQTNSSATTDPFYLERGTSFSASVPSKKIEAPKRTLSSGITSDIAEALSIISKNHVDSKRAVDGRVTASAIRSMMKSLDPHSNFYDPAEFAELLGEHRSEYFGTGVTIMSFRVGDKVETFVIAVAPGSPAANAGLQFGDRIVSVGGKPVSGLSSLVVRELIRGPNGTSVKVTLERQGSDRTLQATLIRGRLPQPTVPASFVIDETIGYIDMTVGFSYTTVTELDAALENFARKGVRSLIIDLRGNTGGILDQSVAAAERFLPAGRTIVTQRGRNPYDDREWKSQNRTPNRLPIVLLIDGETASAAEVFAASLQDNDRAMIVGSKSFGKGLVQNVLELEDGSGLTLTAARYYTPSGRSIQRDYSDASLYEYFAKANRGNLVDRSAFVARTVTGRRVYGGDGIDPDLASEQPDPTREQIALIDPIFHFANKLLNAESNAAGGRSGIRNSIMFGQEIVSAEIMNEFEIFVGREISTDKDTNAFVISELRYFLSLGAFGMAEGEAARIKNDETVRTAISLIPRSQQLAAAAAAKQ